MKVQASPSPHHPSLDAPAAAGSNTAAPRDALAPTLRGFPAASSSASAPLHLPLPAAPPQRVAHDPPRSRLVTAVRLGAAACLAGALRVAGQQPGDVFSSADGQVWLQIDSFTLASNGLAAAAFESDILGVCRGLRRSAWDALIPTAMSCTEITTALGNLCSTNATAAFTQCVLQRAAFQAPAPLPASTWYVAMLGGAAAVTGLVVLGGLCRVVAHHQALHAAAAQADLEAALATAEEPVAPQPSPAAPPASFVVVEQPPEALDREPPLALARELEMQAPVSRREQARRAAAG